jgi:hypothetical protein
VTGRPGDTAGVAAVFDVVDGRVTRLAREDDLAQALAAAGPGEADAVRLQVPRNGEHD